MKQDDHSGTRMPTSRRACVSELPNRETMFGMMSSLIDTELQVLDPVVGHILVPVMDLLLWVQHSAKMVRHHQTMLSNVSMAIRHRMLWNPQQDVSILVGRPPLSIRVVSLAIFAPVSAFVSKARVRTSVAAYGPAAVALAERGGVR